MLHEPFTCFSTFQTSCIGSGMLQEAYFKLREKSGRGQGKAFPDLLCCENGDGELMASKGSSLKN